MYFINLFNYTNLFCKNPLINRNQTNLWPDIIKGWQTDVKTFYSWLLTMKYVYIIMNGGADCLYRKHPAINLLFYTLLIFFAILFMFPLFWMISTSLKSSGEVFSIPPQWIPESLEWGNYVEAVNSFPFIRYAANSVFITVLSIFGGVLSSAYVAYGFAKLEWPGKNMWFTLMLATMMVPSQITMIPLFIFYSRLGWINTYYPFIIPSFLGSPFFIFLFRQFYLSLPNELNEAARIDGASEFQIWRKIYLPLSKPAMATTAIFLFMFTWNDFMGPLIYLHDKDLFTLQLGLRGFQQQYGTRWHVMMAASLLVAIPSIALFLSFQKYFVRGSSVSGIKG